MAAKFKDGLRVLVSIRIVSKDGYSDATIHSAELATTGPLTVKDAIEEARALASKCVNATREAADRAERALEGAAGKVDADAIG